MTNTEESGGHVAVTVDEISERHRAIQERIAQCGVPPESVSVLAVTKTFGPEVVAAAVAAGLGDLGENYAQELLTKAPQVTLTPPESSAARPAGEELPRWHFIGGLQRNKVRKIAELVHLWQTIDRIELAAEVAKRAPGASILVQVNTTGEPQKSGCDPAEIDDLVARSIDLGLDVAGLMTIGPTISSPATVASAPARPSGATDPRPTFALLRSHVDRLGLRVASMGMSGDLEAAVSEGSTMVRVGTALFGPRPR